MVAAQAIWLILRDCQLRMGWIASTGECMASTWETLLICKALPGLLHQGPRNGLKLCTDPARQLSTKPQRGSASSLADAFVQDLKVRPDLLVPVETVVLVFPDANVTIALAALQAIDLEVGVRWTGPTIGIGLSRLRVDGHAAGERKPGIGNPHPRVLDPGFRLPGEVELAAGVHDDGAVDDEGAEEDLLPFGHSRHRVDAGDVGGGPCAGQVQAEARSHRGCMAVSLGVVGGRIRARQARIHRGGIYGGAVRAADGNAERVVDMGAARDRVCQLLESDAARQIADPARVAFAFAYFARATCATVAVDL